MLSLLLIFSCTKEVPPHLRVDTPPRATQELSLSALVSRDPLVRRPPPGAPGKWASSPQPEVMEEWAAIARKTRPLISDWLSLESKSRGSIGVALARGAMLAGLETSTGEWDHPHQQAIAGWLGLRKVAARPTERGPSEPIAWLPGATPKEQHRSALHIATRSVLSGWIDGPGIDLGPVGMSLESPTHTGIADTPTGHLIRARATGRRDPQAAGQGLEHLWHATHSALRWVSADGNRAQATMLKERADFRKAHGANPVAHHLHLARMKLIQDGASDDSAGLAWIALSAERLEGTCPDQPCGGLDLTANIHRAEVWGSTSESASKVWQLIAMKSALDTFEASIDKPLLYRRLPQIVDAFAGVYERGIELPVLRYRSVSPALMVSLSMLINAEPTTDLNHLINLIRRRIDTLCDDALALTLPADIETEVSVLKRLNAKKLHKP